MMGTPTWDTLSLSPSPPSTSSRAEPAALCPVVIATWVFRGHRGQVWGTALHLQWLLMLPFLLALPVSLRRNRRGWGICSRSPRWEVAQTASGLTL